MLSLIRKFSDGGRMSFGQRYRYNEMAQRYAIHSDLWRKKMRIREEGYRRPQDAILSVTGRPPNGECASPNIQPRMESPTATAETDRRQAVHRAMFRRTIRDVRK